jgi:hypothetical protein
MCLNPLTDRDFLGRPPDQSLTATESSGSPCGALGPAEASRPAGTPAQQIPGVKSEHSDPGVECQGGCQAGGWRAASPFRCWDPGPSQHAPIRLCMSPAVCLPQAAHLPPQCRTPASGSPCRAHAQVSHKYSIVWMYTTICCKPQPQCLDMLMLAVQR